MFAMEMGLVVVSRWAGGLHGWMGEWDQVLGVCCVRWRAWPAGRGTPRFLAARGKPEGDLVPRKGEAAGCARSESAPQIGIRVWVVVVGEGRLGG